MMDQTHIGYTSWNEPPANVMPAVSWIQVPEAGSLGVDAEGATLERTGGRFGFSLGTIDSVSDETRTLKLFDRGTTPVKFTVQTSAPWIVPSESAGTVGAAEETSRASRGLEQGACGQRQCGGNGHGELWRRAPDELLSASAAAADYTRRRAWIC